MGTNLSYSSFAVPSAAPENVSAEAVSSTQILLTWASVPEQDKNGLILGYKVRVGGARPVRRLCRRAACHPQTKERRAPSRPAAPACVVMVTPVVSSKLHSHLGTRPGYNLLTEARTRHG